MTKEELISDIESKGVFIKWAVEPVLHESHGTVEKWVGMALVTTPEGHRNVTSVWFIVDGNEAFYQTKDTLDVGGNTNEAKVKALTDYCDATFHAHVIKSIRDNFAFVTTYTLADGSFTEQEVIVYKQGANPITHAPIV